MNGKLYIKKFIRDDGETLSFDAEEIYLSEDNTLLVRSDPATTAVDFTEADGGEMIRQRGAIYHQTVKGLIVPKTSDYWSLCTRLSRFFVFNHTYKIVYVKVNGSMFATNGAWISSGLQIVPVPHENYSYWNIEFAIGNIYWRQYAENSEGEQIYSNSITLPLITASMGGELWATDEVQTLSGEGTDFQIEGTSISATNTDVRLKGDTFQQTYTGKNLLNITGKTSYGVTGTVNTDGTVTISGTGTTTDGVAVFGFVGTLPAGTYTLSISKALPRVLNMSLASGVAARITAGNTSATVTTTQAYSGFSIFYGIVNGTTYNETFKMQLVAGSTPDYDFEPYTAGPAPNPDYPQDVQVVTGEQIIEVSDGNVQDRSYTVDLGSIELCKIGDYQDYIYKSGNNWYVHKEVGKLDVSSSGIVAFSAHSGNHVTVDYRDSSIARLSTATITNVSNRFIGCTATQTWNGTVINGVSQATGGNYLQFSLPSSAGATQADIRTYFDNHPTTVYYALATPADTQITDATLVAQLNALAIVRAYSGTTTYSTSGTPIPVIFHIEMSQSVREGEVWDNVGGVWEAGSGGVQTISVDSTQKIYPVWTVTGPCVNPVLQNNTTDTFASFDGTVAAGQTLTVYFEDGIAYLDSAIATRYVSGYVSFLPGENMVGFNSDGGSAESSTISWDNIIN